MSGVKSQRFTRYLKSRVGGSHVVQRESSRKESHGTLGAESHAVSWERSRREPHGTHTYVESGEAESHAVHQEQSHREPHIMSGSELQEVMLYIWS